MTSMPTSLIEIARRVARSSHRPASPKVVEPKTDERTLDHVPENPFAWDAHDLIAATQE